MFGSSATQPGTQAWDDAFALGRSLAVAGLAVATGGYAGTMEAVSAGAASVSGTVIGVTAASLFPDRSGPNPHVTRLHDEPTVAARIATLVDDSDACIALPGSIGTAAELLVAWNTLYLDSFRSIPKWPLIAVGQPWRVLIPTLEQGLGTTTGIVTLVDSTEEAARHVIENLT